MRHLSTSQQGMAPRHAHRAYCSSRHSSPRPVPSRPVRRSRVLASSTATLEERPPVATVPPTAGAVISQLVGKKVLQLSDSHSAVPLLHPISHSLPFSASLHIYSQSSSPAAAKQASSPLTSRRLFGSDTQAENALVELHYVISGQGYFSNAATEVQQALSPGDSIISLHGAATFTAGPLPQQQQQQEANPTQQQQHSSSPAWSQLLGWLQQLHAKQQQQANPTSRNAGADAPLSQAAAAAAAAAAVAAPPRASSSSSSQLVMLQLLLPSELLTGQMLTHHPGHCHAVAQQLPWGDSAGGLYPNAAAAAAAAGASGRVGQRNFCDVTHAGSIHAAQVCGLLVDAGLSPPATQTHQQQQQQQQQQTEGPFLHSTTQQMPTQVQQQQQQIVPATTNSNTGTAAPAADTADLSSKGTAATITTTSSDSSSDGGSPGHVLPSLNQQQVLKRALSEVGAFRLPHQTNRLALLFGPHSAPAVCCSFGVEVFEPGHVTPLHIHNTAHELFFVLAGKGEAVFRPGTAAAAAGTDDLSSSSSSSSGAQRVVMSPGDVAVFPPGVVHGVDNPGSSQLYCLQMMLPNESFVEWVRSGEEAGRLDVAAVQRLAAAASCG